MKPIITMPSNPKLEGLVTLLPDIPFAHRNGADLMLKMLLPWGPEADPAAKYPLVVFIQGSAWTIPDQHWQIPQLAELARRGYVVASVTHRSCNDVPAPAFLVDVKASIRFLRAHAEEYHIDPERVCAWGTSSGGNTALLLGMTGGDPRYETDENADQSSEVKLVVDCFGPTDLVRMATIQFENPDEDIVTLIHNLAGGSLEDGMDLVRSISPTDLVQDGMTLPPMLLLHGDADDLVLYSDTLAFYEKLQNYGYDSTLVKVEGAPHEGSFWSQDLLKVIFDFIDERI